MSDKTTLSIIKEWEDENAELYKRMDTDKDALYLTKYKLTGIQQFKDKEIPGTISVTLNKPAVFSNAIVSVLKYATRKAQVEGMSDTQNKRVEDFKDDLLYTIDWRLGKQNKGTLWHWLCFHIANRGPIGARITFDKNGLPVCLPVDMRYCPFVLGSDGIEGAANHTWRQASAIWKEYPVECEKQGIATTGILENHDYWLPDVNEFWVAGKKLFEQENTYGFVPFVIKYPTVGSMFQDQDKNAHEAESIFYMIRDLVPEWNRLMSIQMTKSLEMAKPAYVHEVKNTNEEAQPYPNDVGSNLAVPEGELPQLVQTKEVNTTFQTTMQTLNSAMTEGSMSESELGNLMNDRATSWIYAQEEIRNRILTPRLETLDEFYRDFITMAIKEYKAVKFTSQKPLGRKTANKNYAPSELPDPDNFMITFTSKAVSENYKLARATAMVALKGLVSEDTLIRDYGMFDDPQGEINKLARERLRNSDQVIFLFDTAAGLLQSAGNSDKEDARHLRREAKAAADKMVELIHQRKMPTQQTSLSSEQPAQTGKAGNPQALMALPALIGSKGGSGNQQQGVTANA